MQDVFLDTLSSDDIFYCASFYKKTIKKLWLKLIFFSLIGIFVAFGWKVIECPNSRSTLLITSIVIAVICIIIYIAIVYFISKKSNDELAAKFFKSNIPQIKETKSQFLYKLKSKNVLESFDYESLRHNEPLDSFKYSIKKDDADKENKL